MSSRITPLCLSVFQRTRKFTSELRIALLDHRGERRIGSGPNQELKSDEPGVDFPGSSPGNHVVENRTDVNRRKLITQPPVEFIERRVANLRDHLLLVCRALDKRTGKLVLTYTMLFKRETGSSTEPRRNEILEAALRIVADGGPDAITFRGVADRAKVTLGS